MSRVFTNNESTMFRTSGFTVGGKKATIRLEDAGFAFSIGHDGALAVEGRCNGGVWRPVYAGQFSNSTHAATVAAVILFSMAAVDLFAARVTEVHEAETVAEGFVSLEDTIPELPACTVAAVSEQAEVTAEPISFDPIRFTGRKPETLIQFLARKGGIRPDGGLRANDIDKVFVPGFGKLIRKEGSGLPLDTARKLAQEAGYLPADCDWKPAEVDINTLLDAIVANANGERVVSRFDVDAEERLQAAILSERQADYAAWSHDNAAPF